MASISSPGLGSGLDVNSIVSQLMAVESRPLTAFAQKEAQYQAKISAFGAALGAMSSLQSSADALTDPDKFTGLKASVKDSSIASATVDSTAVAGKYSLEVSQLAQAQIVNTIQNPSIPVGGGTLSIKLGANAAVDIAVAGTDGLSDIATSINEDATLKSQIKASVVDNRLVLESLSTGAANTISIASAELTDFVTAQLLTARTAQDAAFKINGITITRDTNTVDDVIDGLTLTLSKASPGTTTDITVSRDVSTAKTALEAFVKAYNDVNKTIGDLTRVDASSKKGSVLTGDATLRTAQSQLRSLLGSRPDGITDPLLTTLSQVGISANRSGTLSLDASKLSAAFSERPESVADLLKAFGTAFESAAGALSGSTGTLQAKIDGLNQSIKTIQSRREAFSLRLDQVEKRYRTQFASLDSLVSSLNKTSSFLTQQLANLPKAGG